MRKVSLFCLVLMLCAAFTSNAQTNSSADFFAGKWEITVKGTPNGDSKLLVDLVRSDSKLTGVLTNPAEPTAEKIPVTASESGVLLELAFNSQGYDVTINFKKEDEDNLKGSVMGMFDADAKRLK